MPCVQANIEAPSDGGNGGDGELSPWQFWNNLSDRQKMMVGAGALASAGFVAMSVGGGGRSPPVRYTNRSLQDSERR